MAYVPHEDPFIVLMAEDSEHDIRAARRAWQKQGIRNPLKIVKDGQECLDYLFHRGEYTDGPVDSHHPGILLLDLNLPKVDGFEILRQIKETPVLKKMPVVILTTSGREEDLERAYELGANAFITKPMGLDKLGEALMKFNLFWEMAGLPKKTDGSNP